MEKIIAAYPGVGKSEICKSGFVDLKCDNFVGKCENWVEQYVSVARDLVAQNNHVLVSTHREVVEYMEKNEIPFLVVCPSLDFKTEWLSKLKERAINNPTAKNKNALETISKNYDEDIEYLTGRKNCFQIKDRNYTLRDIAEYGVANIKDYFSFFNDLVFYR